MTFADVRRQYAHWKRYPPLRDLVAAFVGFKPEPLPDAKADEPSQDAALGALFAAAKAQGGKIAM